MRCLINRDDAYELLEEIYGDKCCSDADYESRPYYEIVEIKHWIEMTKPDELDKNRLLGKEYLFAHKEYLSPSQNWNP